MYSYVILFHFIAQIFATFMISFGGIVLRIKNISDKIYFILAQTS